MALISRSVKTGGGTDLVDGRLAPAADVNTDMNTITNAINGNLDNTNIAPAAGIAYSKLTLTGSVTNADIASGTGIAYSKLALTGAIVNADVSGSAAIAYSKLSLSASIVAGDIAAAGIPASKIDAPYPLDTGIVNGFFDWWQRSPSATGVTVTNGVDTYLADRWAVEPSGANCTVSRVTTDLHTGAVGDVGISITGAASMTSIELTQRIPRATARRLGALLANQNVTFGAKVRHAGSAGTITPTLIVRSTSNTGDDTTSTKFATANMTDRVTQAFTGITTGQESSLSHTFDIGAMTDSQNGIEIVLSFAAMSAATHIITVTDVFLIRGSAAPLTLVRPHEDDELKKCLRFYQKTFPYVTTPAQNAGRAGAVVGGGAADGADRSAIGWDLQAPLIRVPVASNLTTYNPLAANANPRTIENVADVARTAANDGLGDKTIVMATDSSSLTSPKAIIIHATVDTDWYD